MELSASSSLNPQLHIDNDWVTITYTGRGASKSDQGFLEGKKKIPIDQIVSVQYRKSTLLLTGYIHFTIAGSAEPAMGRMDMGSQPNGVPFNSNSEKFLEIKNFIERKIAQRSTNEVELSSSLDMQPWQLADIENANHLERLIRA